MIPRHAAFLFMANFLCVSAFKEAATTNYELNKTVYATRHCSHALLFHAAWLSFFLSEIGENRTYVLRTYAQLTGLN